MKLLIGVLDTFLVTGAVNPTIVLTNPPSGNYTIDLTGVADDATCFTIDVILNGVTVVSGASFTGVIPNLTFVYNLP